MSTKQPSKWGPGMLVTAAFIGPGTVVTASMSGSQHGYSLLWVVLLSVLAAIVFQEMAARLGIVTGDDLSVTLGKFTNIKPLKWALIGLVLTAVLVGNAAYQAGNIAGAVTGLQTLTGTSGKTWAIVIGFIAAGLLWIGQLKVIQNVLIVLVAFMSLLFLASAIMVGPDWTALGKGLLIPSVPADSLMLVIGLLGTTVVPYNLFLHSRSAVENWYDEKASKAERQAAIKQSRKDTVVAITLGGLVTAMILITAAAAFHNKGFAISNIPDIAEQLRPVLGSTSEFIFCLGLAAAGLTSAVTAPLAAGFVAAGCFGWGSDIRDRRTFSVMLAVIAIGVGVILFSTKGTPSDIVLIAQVANGLILPIVAAFLLWAMNRKEQLGSFCNRKLGNFFAVALLLIFVSLVGFRNFSSIKSKFEERFNSSDAPVKTPQKNDD